MSKKRLASMTTSTASFMVLTPSCSRRSEPCFSPILVMASLPTFCPSYPRSSAARIISSRMTPVPALAAFHLYHVGPGSPSFIAHRARNSGRRGRPYTWSHFISKSPLSASICHPLYPPPRAAPLSRTIGRSDPTNGETARMPVPALDHLKTLALLLALLPSRPREVLDRTAGFADLAMERLSNRTPRQETV